jgi:hypothetical protein
MYLTPLANDRAGTMFRVSPSHLALRLAFTSAQHKAGLISTIAWKMDLPRQIQSLRPAITN